MVVTQLGTDGEDDNTDEDDDHNDNDEDEKEEEKRENDHHAATTAMAAAESSSAPHEGAAGGGAGGDAAMMMTLPTQTYPVLQTSTANDENGDGDGDGDGGGTQDDEEKDDAHNATDATASTATTVIHQREAIAEEVSRLLERQVQSETRRLGEELSRARTTIATLRTDLETLRTTSRRTVEAMDAAHRAQLAAVQSQLDAALAEARAASATAAAAPPPKCDCGDAIIPRLERKVSAVRSDFRAVQRKLLELNEKYQRTKRMAKERDGQLRSIARMVQQQQREGEEQDGSPPAFSPSQSQKMEELLDGLESLGSQEDSETDDNDDGGDGDGDGDGKDTSKATEGRREDVKACGEGQSLTRQQQQQTQQLPPHSFVRQLFPAEDAPLKINYQGGDEKVSASTADDGSTVGKKSGGETVDRRRSREQEDGRAAQDGASDHEEMDETPMTEPILLRRPPSLQPAKQLSAKMAQELSNNKDEAEKKKNSTAAVESLAVPTPTAMVLPKNPYAKPATTSSKTSSTSDDAATKPKKLASGAANRGRTKSSTRPTGGSGEKRRRSPSPCGGDSAFIGATTVSAKPPNSLRSLVASAVAASIPKGLTGSQARHPQTKKRKGRVGSTAVASGQGSEKENRENTTIKTVGSRSDIPIPSFSNSPRRACSSARTSADAIGRGTSRSGNTIIINSDDDSSDDEREEEQAKSQMAPPPPRRHTMSPLVPVRTVEVPPRGSKTTGGKHTAVQDHRCESPTESVSIPYTRIPQNRKGKGGKVTVDGSDEPGYKYQEVVRDRDKRRAMKGHECEQCREFYEAIEKGGSGKDFDRKEMVCQHSRHRSNHAPDMTPDGFWEIGFVDSQKSQIPCARRDEDV